MERAPDPTIAVIGAGPAGLMAADVASASGAMVTIYDHMPSPARKFLMAGKSGLNVTRDEDPTTFRAAYRCPPLDPMLRAFGPPEVMAWMEGLGQNIFTGSTRRVFPRVMKASPTLRAWLARLDRQGVTLRRRWRWTGWDGDALTFETPAGPATATPDTTVLAMGGASWRRLGSDGAWAALPGLAPLTAPFAPSNVGLRIDWSAPMIRHFGAALKSIALRAGDMDSRGEVVISAKGLEGGGLYSLTPALREDPPLTADLKPDLTEDTVAARLAKPRGKASLSNHLRKTLRLTPPQIALLREFGGDLVDLPGLIKRLPIRHSGLHDMDEAISTVGGLRWDALDETLMLRDRPGTFAAGEMLDWEAPTGGYLITACLATGAWAGRHATDHAARIKACGTSS
ncbi:TIGR03862 family flavoprotein [Jannaschia aquimarina]|uniref:Putative glutamate synthase subunit beta n=1 Tax=Jannaschia aquimarina TaxID=935700 RepID=A0A0D1CPP1_9RHOB|nr:TIGR03862 family flavoprotein [Jannaschia aquimarina]KIT16727.1 putative glutamate synthase subunit beta [Jannaschia aquimarina]SNS53803.1 hypothetical protein SAMN05421775_101363 [Jannaschia aquimarina]